MKVFLAGYNVDAEVLEELKICAPRRDDVTPETLSAAYARISRDPRPINELRQAARQEVEKSRRSNTSIIFGLGHSSVAEHAVFNFDLVGVSRLAMEEIEKFRLCSFTEKSQRYITLSSDFLVPAELKNSRFEQEYIELIHKQNDLYSELFEKLKNYTYENNQELAKDPKNGNLLEGWAKEDARYITSLATFSQVGMTVNARNLEQMIRRFTAHPLRELQALGQALHTLVKDIAPSLIKYPESSDYERQTYPDVKEMAKTLLGRGLEKRSRVRTCSLVESSRSEDTILAGLVFRSSSLSYADALKKVRSLSGGQRRKFFASAIANMKFYDRMLREFELAELTYEVVLSAACYGQLKRHRLATIIAQPYDPSLGAMVPPSVVAIGCKDQFMKIINEATVLTQKMRTEFPAAADYILTNAHRRRVIFKTNLRGLYHISRLREDTHAQWDIRELTKLMSKLARKKYRLCGSFLGGKDQYDEIYAECVKRD